jgi:tetratricopeptide (TPR) repeat protein
MSINGSLRETSLADVLQLLSMGRKTGCLSLTHRGKFASVFFDAGRVTYATIVNRRDRIGERLVQIGTITSEQLRKALDKHNENPETRLGDILVDMKLVSRLALDQQIRAQVEEAVYLLFPWTDGTFTFIAGAKPEQACAVPINPEALMLEGARRADEWTLIEKTIPSLDLVYAPEATRARGVTDLTSTQALVLQKLDGSLSVEQLAEELGFNDLDIGKALCVLLERGVIRRVERAPDGDRVGAARVDEHRNLGIAFYRSNMLAEAMREFRRVLELRPDDEQARAFCGHVHARQSNWQEALEDYRVLAERPDRTTSALHNCALAQERLGNYEEARDLLAEAARRTPDDARIQTSLGAVMLLLGEAKEADIVLSSARALWIKTPPPSWYHYAVLAAMWLGEVARAESLLEEAIEAHKRVAVLHNNLAALLEQRSAWGQALEVAEKGVQEDQALPQLHKNIGDLHYRVGRYEDALAAYEKAVAADDALGADVYLKLGNIALRRADQENAERYWRRALELDPQNAIVQRNLTGLGHLATPQPLAVAS